MRNCRPLFLFLAILILAGQSSSPAANLPADPSLARLTDYTDKLTLKPGIAISFPIFRGIDTRWKHIGDYQFTAQIVTADSNGLIFDWTMSSPADSSGSRAVMPDDLRNSHKVSLFYPKRESCTLTGFTNAIRVSDAIYKNLKSGKRTALELDGPEPPPGSTRDPRFSPSTLTATGLEPVAIYVNGQKARVRAIKANTDNGWTYWIMDNPNFPLMVQGNGPFAWAEPRFDTSVADAKDVINQLEGKGEATTYSVLFDFDKATLKSSSKAILNELGKYLTAKPEIRLEVQGHTDNKGTHEYNMALSQRRSEAVADYLIKNCAIAPDRLTCKGFGFTLPVASNDDEPGRARNRRVVFKKM